MSAQRISPILTACALLLGLSAALGCRIERPASRIERREAHLEQLASAPLPVLPQPEYDQAAQVIQFCGQPGSDTVAPAYTKYYNGPVRRLEYGGRFPVTLDFIPSRPRAELAYTEAPLPRSDNGTTAIPPNATWRFEAGRMKQETMITAHRLSLYLPCAGEALRHDF